MKSLAALILLLLLGCATKPTATVPPNFTSSKSDRAQIMDVIRFDDYRDKALAQQNPQGIKFVVKHYEVKDGWACVYVIPTKSGKDFAEPRWTILHKVNGEWLDVDYPSHVGMKDDTDALDVLGFTGNTSARVAKAFPGLPKDILP